MRTRRAGLPAVASLVCLAAAALTLVSTFLPLFVGDLSGVGRSATVSITSWRAESGSFSSGDVPENGLPLLCAALGLLGAALTGLVASSTPSLRRTAGTATGMAAAFVTAAAWLVIVQVDSWLELQALEILGLRVDVGAGGGLWMLLAGAFLSIVAAVLWLVSGQTADAEDADAPTPPTGFAVPVVLPNTPKPD